MVTTTFLEIVIPNKLSFLNRKLIPNAKTIFKKKKKHEYGTGTLGKGLT